MKDKINKICTELNHGKIAVVQATEQLFDLYSVSQQRGTLFDFYKEMKRCGKLYNDSYTEEKMMRDISDFIKIK